MRIPANALRTCAVVTATALAATTVTPAFAQEASGPKNIIYMIGDGMGYNHLSAANLYETGQTRYQLDGPADPAQLEELPGEAVQVYENFDHLAMTALHDLECVADHGVGFGVAQHVEVLAGTR